MTCTLGRRASRLATAVLLLVCTMAFGGERRPQNLLANGGFEEGNAAWRVDKGGETVASLAIESQGAREGQRCARVTIGKVASWGTQFGQTLEAGEKGRTYTLAVLARSAAKPVTADLQIERTAKPWDRAAKSGKFTLTSDKWTEMHVTFAVGKDFREGWFAYISCGQADCAYLADGFRLYEGGYVPYEKWLAMGTPTLAAQRLAVYDTVKPSAERYGPQTLAEKAGWRELPEGAAGRPFAGDAVLTNGRLSLVVRRGATGAELHGDGGDGPSFRALLSPAGSARVAALSAAEIDPASTAIDVTYRIAGGASAVLRHRLGIGQVFAETEPRSGADVLRVTAPCRFAVLPDFFADDIVIDATTIPAREGELPSENMLLSLVGSGQAIVMSVWQHRDRDVQVAFAGEGGERKLDTATIHFGKKGKAWTAVLEGEGVWHHRDVATADRGKELRLDWQWPFPAMWRADWRRDTGLTDSWEMAVEQRSGRYLKPGWFGSPHTLGPDRKRWTTVLGRFLYPCWVDTRGQGYLQPLSKVSRFEGPAILYPVNRLRETPLDAFTVVDIVRATLGVGPCEYILDVESHGEAYKGRATCGTRDVLCPIYQQGRQKQERPRIEEALRDVNAFVQHIRSRVEDYVKCAHELLALLAEQKQAHPEFAAPLAKLEGLARQIDARYAARKEKIKTPAYVKSLTDKFRAELLDYEGADAFQRCKAITEAIVVVGGNQDELVGECRMVVKWIRQQAALDLASEPRLAPIVREIRARTQKILRNPTSYEAPRH